MEPTGEPIHVLHVDDDPAMRETAAALLEREGTDLTVSTAADAAEGLAALADGDYDCVVSDYDMPDRNGIEFLEAVRDSYPDLPFVLFTGKGSEEIASRAISAGVTDYLQKAAGAEQYAILANRIRNAVAGRRAHEAAERAEQQRRRVYERIADGFVALDTDWRYTFVNNEAASILGRSEDDLVGDVVWDTFPGLVDTRFEQAIRTAMETQEPTSVEAYFEPHAAWYSVRAYPSPDGLSIYFRDVTERKEREVAIERERDRFEAVFETVPEPVIHFTFEDGNPIARNVNRAFESVFGYAAEVAEGQSVDDLIVPDEKQSEAEAHNRELRETGSVEASLSRKTADGEREFLFTGRTMTVGEGADSVVEGVASYVDITEQKQRETELARQNERLERFASIVSHDLRNPLNVAAGNVELAQQECDSDHLEAAAAAHERMVTLIDELLTLAREGSMVTAFEPVQLDEVADSCWGHVETGEATLRTATTGRILAAPDRLRRLLENLIRNSVEHGVPDSETGALTVTVGDLDDGEGFFVADDGVGIPSDDREQVFESGYSTSADGTGFGLTIVDRIADAHGWDVCLTTGADGGTRVEFRGVDRPE